MILGTVIVALAALGCAEPEPEASAASEPGRRQGFVDLEIGEIDGEDAYVFGSVSGIALDSADRVFVSDFQAHEVRVFDADGVFRFAFGGEGDGPGEFVRPCCLGWGPGGHLWVYDSGNRRYSGFRILGDGAELAETVRGRHQGANEFEPVTFDAAGRLVDVGALPQEDGAFDIVRIHLAGRPDGDSAHVIESAPPEEVGPFMYNRNPGRFFLWQPHGPRHLVAHGPGGRWARAVTSEYRVELHRPGAPSVAIENRSVEGPALTAEEREQAESEIAEQVSSLDIPRGDVPYGVPDRKPPVRTMWFDARGRLWIERNVVGSQRVADVYDSLGIRQIGYRWPARVDAERFRWASADVLLGITRDSLGVQRVARVRFTDGR